MRTLIQGGWIVGFQHGQHTILRDGVVVFEDNRILYVGPQFAGQVDALIQATGKLVAPGFVNLHALASFDIQALAPDVSDSAAAFTPFTVTNLDNNGLQEEELSACLRYSLLQLLKGGSTTIVGATTLAPLHCAAPHHEAPLLVAAATELGARLYVSHPFQAARGSRTDGGAWRYDWDEAAGQDELSHAQTIVRRYEGAHGDRIRTLLSPYRFASCSPDLLRNVKAAADDLAVPVQLRVAESLLEFHECLINHGRTPVKLLYDIGFLDETTLLTHLLYTTMHPASGFPVDDAGDLRLVAASGATVTHCPVAAARRGHILASFSRYGEMGVNVGIGTGAFPQDMIEEMRWAALGCKWVDRDANRGTARDVFNAATLGGARALGRSDIGRLAAGAKADIIIVDLQQLHHGPVDDPIKTLVYAASGCDVDTVIVDGRLVLAGGKAPGVDEAVLRRAVVAAHRLKPPRMTTYSPEGKLNGALYSASYPVVGGEQ